MNYETRYLDKNVGMDIVISRYFLLLSWNYNDSLIVIVKVHINILQHA